jgi:hypothetical protein
MTRIKTATDDAELAAKIVDAMKEYDAADATRKEKAIVAGKLLAEAQKRHPTQKAFEQFLELAGGVQYRRAVDLIGIAHGRKDFEQHQTENAAAAQRHRDKLKAEKIEREKAKPALPKPEPKSKGNDKPEPKPTPGALRNAQEKSAAHFREFKSACETYLILLNSSDLEKAGKLFQRCWASAKLLEEEAKKKEARKAA